MDDELFMLGACRGAEEAISTMQAKIDNILHMQGLSLSEKLLLRELLRPLITDELANNVRSKAMEYARDWLAESA